MNTTNSLTTAGLTLTAFDDTLTISPARVEYTSWRKRFETLADELYEKADAEIDQAAKDIVEFCDSGDNWAMRYFCRAADLAAKIMAEKGCYDIDASNFASKYLNKVLWDKRMEELREAIAKILAEEEEGAQGRSERWQNAGNWYAKNQYSEQYVKDKNFKENLGAGALNVLSWGFDKMVSSSGKKTAYKESRQKLLNSLYVTVKTSVDELVDCMADHGIDVAGAKVAKADSDKAEALFNNLQSGNIPQEAVHNAKMDILRLNPYIGDFYKFVYELEGDKSGDLEKVAAFFGFPLDELKESAFRKRLGKCAYETEEETIQYRANAVALAQELRVDASSLLEKIDAKLHEFDVKARTVDGREFPTREEAAVGRQFAEFEAAQDLSTEEKAIATKAALLAKAQELNLDASWKLVRVDKAIKRFDELARTTFGILFETREKAREALGDRELFYKGIEETVRATKEDAFYTAATAPEKKIVNARAAFPVPPEEYILALTDTTLFGSGKTGLAVTKWGLRWANGGSTKTNVKALSWEEIANLPPPVCDDGDFTLAPGGVYGNSGSNVDEKKMGKVLTSLFEYCRLATFLVTKSADELAKEEEALPFDVRMKRILSAITDSGFLYGARIPEKKRAKAAKACMVDGDDEILAVIDSTLLGTAATCMVVSAKGVYWHNKEDAGKCFIAWEKMHEYKETIVVKEGNRLVFSQGFGFKSGLASVDLEKLKTAFLSISALTCK